MLLTTSLVELDQAVTYHGYQCDKCGTKIDSPVSWAHVLPDGWAQKTLPVQGGAYVVAYQYCPDCVDMASVEEITVQTLGQAPAYSEESCPICGIQGGSMCRCPDASIACSNGHTWRWAPIIEKYRVVGDTRLHRRVIGYHRVIIP